MWRKKEEGLTKDEIFQIKSAVKDIANFREEIKSFRMLIDSIDRRTNPAAMVDPDKARKEVVEAIVTMLLFDKEMLLKYIKETAIERLTEGTNIDTSSIEESLSRSDTFLKEVLKQLDIDKVKKEIVNAAADKVIEDNIDTDNIQSEVAETISNRLEVKVTMSKPEGE